MAALADVFSTLHLVLQFGFLGVTFLLMLVTLVNRLRVRHVLVSWRKGRFFVLPLGPILFICLVLLFFGYSLLQANALPVGYFAGYLVGGLFWFTSGLLSGSVLVSEYGLVAGTGRAEPAVAWGQIVDYFDVSSVRRHQHYVFFYLDDRDCRRRLELNVPAAHLELFRQIVSEKLDTRFDFSAQQVYRDKALEG